jgi:membrane-associated phospholipid phosphatase
MKQPLWTTPRFIMIFSLFLFFLFGALLGAIIDEIWGDKQLLQLDQAVSHQIFVNQNPHHQLFFLTITNLGESGALTVMTILIATGLLLDGRKLEAILFVGGFGITGASVYVLKCLTDRIGPVDRILPHEVLGAFPSGHAALSLFFFGFIAYFLSRKVKKLSHGLFIFSGGLFIAGLIGISRVYLNVHWVSDVLGGFALAAAFLSLCIGFLEIEHQHTRHRNKVSAGTRSK